MKIGLIIFRELLITITYYEFHNIFILVLHSILLFPQPPLPLHAFRLESVGSFWRLDINIPVLLHSDILPDAPLLGAATRPTASSRRAATRG